MRKIIMALMCITMSLAATAQPGERKNAPQAMMRGQNWQRNKGYSQVINMQVIKSLNLDSTKVNEIKDLRKKKAQEMRELYQSMRPQQAVQPVTNTDNKKADKKDKKKDKMKVAKEEKGEKKTAPTLTMDEKKAKHEQFMAKMKENREKMQAFMKGYRAELRQTLGDEKYIEYLEKLTMQQQDRHKSRQPQLRNSKRMR